MVTISERLFNIYDNLYKAEHNKVNAIKFSFTYRDSICNETAAVRLYYDACEKIFPALSLIIVVKELHYLTALRFRKNGTIGGYMYYLPEEMNFIKHKVEESRNLDDFYRFLNNKIADGIIVGKYVGINYHKDEDFCIARKKNRNRNKGTKPENDLIFFKTLRRAKMSVECRKNASKLNMNIDYDKLNKIAEMGYTIVRTDNPCERGFLSDALRKLGYDL